MAPLWMLIVIVSLAFSALFSGTEIAFVTSDRVRVELDVKKGGMVSNILNQFYNRSELFISAMLVGNNIMVVIYGIGAAKLLEPWLKTFTDNEALILVLQTLISTIVILITGEFFPKATFKVNPNATLRFFALPVWLIYIILYPISVFATWLSRSLMRLFGVKSESNHLGMLSVGDLTQYLERTIDENVEEKKEVDNEVKMFHNALDFSTTHLRDCMIPRNEIVAVNIDTTSREQLSELFTQSGRSKIIVYREDIDDVLGYIHVSELFDPEVEWTKQLKPVLFAPETLMANKMMRRLLAEKRSLAVVIDEFGGTAGLVTLEDLVEEIFGDIEDEHDRTTETSREVAPGVYEISGRAEVEELNERYHLNIPEDDEYQTLAGYILHSTGRIPAEGDVVLLGDLRMDILKKSATRLELIRVSRATEAED